MSATDLIMCEAKAMLDRNGITVRQFSEAYGVTPHKCMSVNEVAEVLGVAAKTVRAIIDRGELASTSVGDRVMVRQDKLAEYIEKNTETKHAS